ncbi:oxidoreductase [Companilactobacillus tucceti DSM 20183]|uniref:Oxidoreductase n=1 Tax=Companilactobacillus tucceti DSM 20183 TaxID=1423811 RepID=A0A0R1IXW7_9LACO|nr:oxidoreductase [Companilactobacillus tucceti DSM 20183]
MKYHTSIREKGGLILKYLITGVTGQLGSKILEEIKKIVPKNDVVAGIHSTSKIDDFREKGLKVVKIDYFDRDSLVSALRDIDIFVYIPSKSYDSFTRITELEYVIRAARKANVKHLIAMGFIGDQVNDPFVLSAFYGYMPRRLASSGLKYTIIRNSLYADTLISYLPEILEKGNVNYPMKDKALSFISLEDSAKAFAKVAVDDKLRQNERIYTLTESRNYTMLELANILSKVTGRKIGYQPADLSDFEDMHNKYGEGYILGSMYKAGSRGLLQELSNDYQVIMGHEATSLLEFLKNRVNEKSF